jgi:hypothetical protein
LVESHPDEPGFQVFPVLKNGGGGEELQKDFLIAVLGVRRLPAAEEQDAGHRVAVGFHGLAVGLGVDGDRLLSVLLLRSHP